MCVAKHWWYALGTQFCVFKLIFLLHWVIQLLVFHYSSNWTRKRTNSGLSTGQNCTPFLEFDSLETWSGSDYQLPPPCPVNKIRWYSMFLWIKIALFFEVPRKGMILCISLLQPSVKHKIWNMNKFANLLTFNTGPLINIFSAGSIQWLY